MNPAAAPGLDLKGARKKPEPRPRTEGITKLGNRPNYYLRVYPPGSKRATYKSTRRSDKRGAEAVVPHLRAQLQRPRPQSPPPQKHPTFF
jgi:hypothetical protein